MKHGMTGTRIYQTWHNMKSRCHKEYDSKYKYYGGKGIKVCDEWRNDFNAFYEWAMANGYTDELTIDRIDSDKDYCPENCRWVTMEENRALAQGVTHEEWVENPRYQHSGIKEKYGMEQMSKIKEARKLANLTQSAMAERLGIPKRTIEAWEGGKRIPPEYVERLIVEELERIAQESKKE